VIEHAIGCCGDGGVFLSIANGETAARMTRTKVGYNFIDMGNC